MKLTTWDVPANSSRYSKHVVTSRFHHMQITSHPPRCDPIPSPSRPLSPWYTTAVLSCSLRRYRAIPLEMCRPWVHLSVIFLISPTRRRRRPRDTVNINYRLNMVRPVEEHCLVFRAITTLSVRGVADYFVARWASTGENRLLSGVNSVDDVDWLSTPRCITYPQTHHTLLPERWARCAPDEWDSICMFVRYHHQ